MKNTEFRIVNHKNINFGVRIFRQATKNLDSDCEHKEMVTDFQIETVDGSKDANLIDFFESRLTNVDIGTIFYKIIEEDRI